MQSPNAAQRRKRPRRTPAANARNVFARYLGDLLHDPLPCLAPAEEDPSHCLAVGLSHRALYRQPGAAFASAGLAASSRRLEGSAAGREMSQRVRVWVEEGGVLRWKSL